MPIIRPFSTTQRGLSIVELMVSLTIGLFLVAGISYVYIGSKDSYRLQNAVAQVQENGRLALETLSKDIRMAGYWGCGGGALKTNAQYVPPTPPGKCSSSTPGSLINTLNNASTMAFNMGRPIDGFEASTSSWSPALDSNYSNAKTGTDVIVIRGAEAACSSTGAALKITKHSGGNPPGSSDIQVNDASCINDGDILIATDCVNAGVFQATNVNSGKNVVHNTGTTNTPGNVANDLCKDYTGGELLKAFSRAYYVKTVTNTDTSNYCPSTGGSATVPALYRKNFTNTEEQIVCGIENMQFMYGVDTNTDDYVDGYYTAAEVNSNSYWDRIVSVQVSVTVASMEANVVQSGTDRRFRQTFSTTISVRNRAQ